MPKPADETHPEQEKQDPAESPSRSGVKVILLGAGDSGKSTVFRQIKSKFGDGFTTEQRKSFKPVIESNILHAMKTLIKYSDILDPQFGTRVSDAALDSKAFISALDDDAKLDEVSARHVQVLWADKGIKLTLSKSSLFQLPESAEYFFQKVDVVFQPSYVPSFQDILRSRARTTGIQQIDFAFSATNFSVIDVGGQRNERKKWKKSFQGVSAVIFVAAISEYDQMLFEDSSMNRMAEALHLFSEINTSHWFKKSQIVLFLNKADIFAEKITNISLKVCFPEYEGSCDYTEAVNFIERKFRDLVPKDKEFYCHITTATESESIESVFKAVADVAIRRTLEEKTPI